jgi:hypothetical protein
MTNSLAEAELGRNPEKELGCGMAISVKKSLNDLLGVSPWHLRPQAKGHEVASHFFPGRLLLSGADFAEVVKSHKRPVSPAKPSQNNRHPAGNEPGGNQAFGVHINRCAIEALLPHVPVLKRQKQGPDHRTDRVLKVRDQLNRQEGKSPSPFSTYKAGNGDFLLLEFGEDLNGIPPIRSDLSIAIRTVADGARRPNGGRKINLTGKEGFSVFPKGLKFVKVGELNFSAPCSQGERLWAAQTFGPPSLLGLVIFPRSIPYLAHSPTLISLVKISCKYQTLWLIYIAVDNRGTDAACEESAHF